MMWKTRRRIKYCARADESANWTNMSRSEFSLVHSLTHPSIQSNARQIGKRRTRSHSACKRHSVLQTCASGKIESVSRKKNEEDATKLVQFVTVDARNTRHRILPCRQDSPIAHLCKSTTSRMKKVMRMRLSELFGHVNRRLEEWKSLETWSESVNNRWHRLPKGLFIIERHTIKLTEILFDTVFHRLLIFRSLPARWIRLVCHRDSVRNDAVVPSTRGSEHWMQSWSLSHESRIYEWVTSYL